MCERASVRVCERERVRERKTLTTRRVGSFQSGDCTPKPAHIVSTSVEQFGTRNKVLALAWAILRRKSFKLFPLGLQTSRAATAHHRNHTQSESSATSSAAQQPPGCSGQTTAATRMVKQQQPPGESSGINRPSKKSQEPTHSGQ